MGAVFEGSKGLFKVAEVGVFVASVIGVFELAGGFLDVGRGHVDWRDHGAILFFGCLADVDGFGGEMHGGRIRS